MRSAVLIIAALAALAFAASADAANITHHANADFFSYVEDGPIGSGWSDDIPPENIPGGVNPSNAVARLTDAETRHAFVGTFEAYFRRFMASHAFGTAETEKYSLDGGWSTNYTYEIESADDWKTDETMRKLIGTNLGNIPTNSWTYATNRVYAVTNISIVVTNWVGWTTNVVTTTNGQKRVKISNRYQATTLEIPDTSRILETYKDAHDYVRGVHTKYLPRNPNGLDKLIGLRPGGADDHYGTPEDSDFAANAYRWPRRKTIQTWWMDIYWYTNTYYHTVELRTNHVLNAEWPESANIGWSWSQVANYVDLQGVDPFVLGNSEGWVDRLSDLMAEDAWGCIFPTTWDIWGCQFSRQKISDSIFPFPGVGYDGDEYLFGYAYNCEDDYEATCDFIENGPMMTDECLMTNHFVIVHTNYWDGVVETNEYDLIQPVLHHTTGYEMLTNFVEICPATEPWTYTHTNIVSTAAGVVTNVAVTVVSNLQDRVRIVPNVGTTKRINWTEWAGTDGFIALTDTALIGPIAMPCLKYDVYTTNADITVNYTSTNQTSHIAVHGWGEQQWGEFLGWHWAVTGVVDNVSRTGQSASGGTGSMEIQKKRQEMLVVGNAGLSAGGNFSPGEVLEDAGEWDDGVGENCGVPARRENIEALSRLAVVMEDYGTPLTVGDVVFFDYRFGQKPAELEGLGWVFGWTLLGKVSEYDVDVPFAGDVLCVEYPGDIYLDLGDIDIEAHCNVGVKTTGTSPRRFKYNLNTSMDTNSVPCGYPNPSYAGDGKVEEVDEIKASVLAVIASTTNCYNNGDGDFGMADWNWDTNGYRFASFSAGNLESAKDVDVFFWGKDFELDEKLKDMVTSEIFIRPTTNMSAIAKQVASEVDSAMLHEYGEAIVDSINEAVNAPGGETNISFTINTFYDPSLVKITSISPTADYGDPYQPQKWYEISYQVVRPQLATNAQQILYYEWIPVDENLRRCWSGNFHVNGITNEFIKTGGMAAQGRLTGIEAVKWDFQSMKRARDLK